MHVHRPLIRLTMTEPIKLKYLQDDELTGNGRIELFPRP